MSGEVMLQALKKRVNIKSNKKGKLGIVCDSLALWQKLFYSINHLVF